VIGWPQPQWLLGSQIEFLQLPSVGFEQYVGRGLENEPRLRIANAQGVFSIAAAEHFLAMMFGLARRLHKHVEDKLNRRWRRQQEYWEITGSTVCIVGMGGIGTEIARRCSGIGMKVVGVARHPENVSSHHLIDLFTMEDIQAAVEHADHVVACIPASDENRHLFDAFLFASMKPGACFYNLARGSLVDEDALLSALVSEHLRGAGLDVFQEEPLPREHPLWSQENVIITPHAAGRSVNEHDRICDLFVDNLKRFHNGEPLRNRIMEPTI
jgi:phosphoglycerate dehydrogenase-like enzyme